MQNLTEEKRFKKNYPGTLRKIWSRKSVTTFQAALMGMEAMMMVMTGCRDGENYCQRTCRPHHCPGSSLDRHGWGIEVILHCFTSLLGQKDCFLGRSSSVWRRKHGKGSCLALPIIRVFLYLSLYLLLLILLLLFLLSLLLSLCHCYFQRIVLPQHVI